MSQIDTTLSLIQTLGSADMFDYIEVSLCFAIGVMQSLEEITISQLSENDRSLPWVSHEIM